MRAMILAAGRGTRMQQLTEHTPKPLLKVGGRYLIEYAIAALKNAGIVEIVINVSYRAEQIQSALGAGERYGVAIHYSEEAEPLETGGGILKALPMLGPEPFIALSADVISDYPLHQLPKKPAGLAHLVLVDNPLFHPHGDFCLMGQHITLEGENKLTFGNIGVYDPALFADCKPGVFGLGGLLKEASKRQQVTGEYYQGLWHNVGTANDIVIAEQHTRLVSLV